MTTKHVLTIAAATLAFQLSHAGDVTFGGFISNGYLQSSANNYLADTEDGDFDFVEAGINATWVPMDRTTVRGQLFTFELGPYGNFDPLVDYLFVDYNVNPAFGFRAGRLKRPEGIYTEIQDIDVARTSILLPTGMYDARYRDFTAVVDGISFYGNIQAGNHSFEYNAYYGGIDLNKEGGLAAFVVTNLSRDFASPEISRLDVNSNYGIQTWWTPPLPGLRIGAMVSKYNGMDFGVNATIPGPNLPILLEQLASPLRYQFSIEYYIGDWTLISEYNTMKVDSDKRASVAGVPGEWASSSSSSEVWYISASRRFLDKFEAGLTYSEYFGNKTLKSDPSQFQKDTQFSIRYDATENWSLKTEIHLMNGTNRLFNHIGQNPGDLDEKWTLFAAKSTFAF